MALSTFGLPRAAGGTPVAAAASCTKFFESNISGVAAAFVYGPQSRLWLTEGGLNPRLVRGISPSGGADVTYSLGDPDLNATGDPQGITVGADGRLWIAGGVNQSVVALDLSSGAVTSFAAPGDVPRIASGPDGNLWVTLQDAPDAILKLNTSGAIVKTYPLAAGTAPLDITAASDGALWFTEAGAAKIGRITTSGVVTEYAIGAPAYDITASGTDIWFTERAASKVGHLSTLGPLFYEVATPTASAGPQGITVGNDGGVWFTETFANRVGRLDPGLPTINETLVEAANSPTEMIAIPDGTVWFGTATNHVEHFKPNPGGTVGPLPPSIALTIGSPVQLTPGGPVYSTTTPFTISGTVDQCLDNVYYLVYPAGSTPGAYTQAGTSVTFTLPSSGTWTVDFYAVGPGGQSLPQSVTLVVDQSLFAADTTPPVITTPGNIVAAATSASGAIVSYVVTAADVKDGDVTSTVVCAPPPGSLFAIGTTTVSCTAHDLTGNIATSTFNVTVTAGAPTVTVPSNLVVVSTGATNPITFMASAASPWGGAVDVTCTPPGTTSSSPGTFTYAFPHDTLTTVTCVSAADGLGQRGSGSFTVYPVTSPALTLPANITVTATGPTTPVSYTATATNGNGASLPITCSPASGSLFGLGTTPVTCSATDHGVTTTGGFTVTVNAPPPVITTPGDLTFVPFTSTVVDYVVTAASVVDGSLPVTCVPPSGWTFLLGATPVVCTTTDKRGVTVTQSFTVTVVNTEPSTLTITSAPQLQQGATTLTVQLSGPLGAPIATRSVTITVNGITYAAVTGPAGIATLTLALAPGTYTVAASFAGDTRWFPSSATTQRLTVFGATQFVIWGGNAAGVVPGQRVIFWGEHWWDGALVSDKLKVKEFKGWADTVNGAFWSSKGGDSKPPETIATYISVIITTSVEKVEPKDLAKGDKTKVTGNVVGHAILRVDSPYKNEPGKPVYGVVVAVIP